MTESEKKDIESRLKSLRITKAVAKGDPALDLSASKQKISDVLRWAKQFFRDDAYQEELPASKQEQIYYELAAFADTLENIMNLRDDNPAALSRGSQDYINDLDARYGTIYVNLIEPYRNYLVYKGGDELTVEEIEKTRQQVRAASVVQEEAAEASSSDIQTAYRRLANEFKTTAFWWGAAVMAWILAGLTTVLLIADNTSDNGIINVLRSFNTTEGLTLKIALVVIYWYGLSFLARNYQTNRTARIHASIRATNLEEWRGFVAGTEFHGNDEARAYITQKLAEQVFSDINLEHSKRSTKLIENPISIYADAKKDLDDAGR